MRMLQVVISRTGFRQIPGNPERLVLLDNFNVADMRKAVAMVAGKLEIEASGGITLETIGAIAETGVDYASSGWITHSAPNLDIALDIEM